MKIDDDSAILIIKPYYCARIKRNRNKTYSIYLDLNKWKKKFPGEFLDLQDAECEVQRLGFRSFILKDHNGNIITNRTYFAPWWKEDGVKDWKQIYSRRGVSIY